jgi:hypothetical protein
MANSSASIFVVWALTVLAQSAHTFLNINRTSFQTRLSR